jgi:putative oxidoreductase
MKNTIHGLTTVLGRLLLATIFLMSAVGNKIPNFDQVAST